MEVAKPVSESLSRPTCAYALCEGFALIFLIKLSFTWDMGLFWLHHPFIYLSVMKQAEPILTIMECKTGNLPLLTKAIIHLNVFHFFSSVTQKPYKWHIIRSHLFGAFAFTFIHVCEWESKQHNHSSVWLCLVRVRKDRQTNKYIILFPLPSQKNKFDLRQKSQKKYTVPCGGGVLLRNIITFATVKALYQELFIY